MRILKFRSLIALMLCLLAVFVAYISFPKTPKDDRLAVWLCELVNILQRDCLMRHNDGFFVARDYVATDDVACANSWRMALFYRVDREKCWNEPANSKFDDEHYGIFCFYLPPSTPRTERYTQIMAVVGPNTPFTEVVVGRVRFVSDLPQNAILFLEISQKNVPWMQAGDVKLFTDLKAAAKGNELLGTGMSTRGRWVAFADGTAWLLDKSTPISSLLPFCTMDNAKLHDRDSELGQYKLRERAQPVVKLP